MPDIDYFAKICYIFLARSAEMTLLKTLILYAVSQPETRVRWFFAIVQTILFGALVTVVTSDTFLSLLNVEPNDHGAEWKAYVPMSITTLFIVCLVSYLTICAAAQTNNAVTTPEVWRIATHIFFLGVSIKSGRFKERDVLRWFSKIQCRLPDKRTPAEDTMVLATAQPITELMRSLGWSELTVACWERAVFRARSSDFPS